MNVTLLVLATLAPWQTPEVNEINRLAPRTVFVPSETEALAFDIRRGFTPVSESRWVISLNGTWDFKWKRTPEADWERSARLAVPGCWQLQGDFDPPLYVNSKYPLAFDGSGDPMKEPEKSFTSYAMRNPVGLYTTTFRRPWRWWLRRTVLHFNGVSSAFALRVNGRDVGYSEDSRLPAEFDISPYLKWFGENKIEVEVYKHCDGTYLEDQDFWRLSGIFRDVYAISEHPRAPRDLVVETWLSDDYSHGRFKVLDEKGNVLKEREVDQPKLWSCDYPYLYLTPIEFHWGWWIFGGTDYYAATLGFRRVEIKDGVLCLNGKRVVFRGVNRHEMSPSGGYAVDHRQMEREMRLIKSYNINAVRTCHYPDDPAWYALCDLEGIMVIAEANVETHGAGYGEKSLARDPRWQKSHIERATRMVRTYRNHPSIILWSLGNESGDGTNFAASAEAVRALDPTRPVHYCHSTGISSVDVDSEMYTSPDDVARRAATAKRPYILCEYAHAMGNSCGDVERYMELTRRYPHFQGGFVWDFADQALWKNGEGGRFLAYGGDFGDEPNDGNFNCNGLFDAQGTPHPGANEVKWAYRPIRVTSFDFATKSLRVENTRPFADCTNVECAWESFDGAGAKVASGTVDVHTLGADSAANFTVEGEVGEAIVFRFYSDDDDTFSWDSFSKPFVAAESPSGQPTANPGLRFNFWRAPTDNDRGWKMSEVCAVWKKATETQTLPAGVKSDLKFQKLADGATRVDWTLVVPAGLPPIPRVGLSFVVPAKEPTVSWFGYGPWENYADRVSGAVLGNYSADVTLASGYADEKSGRIVYRPKALNPDNYIEPGEQGYRTGCRRLTVGDVTVTALGAPFGFNAWPYPQTELEGKAHVWEMKATDETTVNIDAVQMGVGGDNSWGKRPHAPYMPGAGTYRLSFILKGSVK